MKIAFILPSLDNKGPIVAAKNIITSLKEYVDLIEVFYFNDKIGIDMGVTSRKISFFKKYDLEKFDIINSYSLKPDVYTAVFFKNDNRVITTMHNYMEYDFDLLYSPLKSFIMKNIWKNSLKFKNNIIVSSTDMLTYYLSLLGRKEEIFTIIKYGVEKKELKSISELDLGKIIKLQEKFTILGSVGLLIKRKGYQQLVELLKSNKNYAVVIIGDGEENKSLLELVKDNNLIDRFLILGFKNNSIDYYKYFDIYMMTSYSEGCSLAMLEALSQKLPLVCSNINNHKTCFTEDEVSFFELDNLNSLSNAVLKINDNIDYYKKSSFSLWKEKFSLEVVSKIHYQLYNKIKEKK